MSDDIRTATLLKLADHMKSINKALMELNKEVEEMMQDIMRDLREETKAETQNSNLTFEKRTMRDCYNCKRYETEGECIECHFEPKDKQTEPTTEDCSEVDPLHDDCFDCDKFFTCDDKGEDYKTDCPWK